MTDTQTRPQNAVRPRRWRWWSIGLVVVLVGVVGGLWWFFGGEAPGEVDLAETASAVDGGSDLATTAASDDTSTSVEGTWSVDTSVGSFSVTEDTTATFAGFRVEEVLESVGSATAVGRTPAVAGSIEIEGTTLVSAEIVADLTQIASDRSRRDDAIQRALGTASNPDASFVLTTPIDLGEGALTGETVSVVATGELTINGVTNTVEIPLEAQLVDGTILVTGSLELQFSDYGVSAPTAPIVLSVEDHGILELQLWLSR